MPDVPAKLKAPSFRLRRSAYAVFSPKGKYLAQIGPRVIIWDVAARKVASEFKAISNEWDLRFSPDERTIVVKNSNGELAFCDVASGGVISTTGSHGFRCSGTAPVFLPDGRHLIDGSWSGDLRVIEVATAKEFAKHAFGANYSFGTIVDCPATACVYATLGKKGDRRGSDRLIRYPYPFAFNRLEEIPPVKSQATNREWRDLQHFAVSPDGAWAAYFAGSAVATEANRIEIFRLDGSKALSAALESWQHHVRMLGWSRDGILVASVQHNVAADKPGYSAWLEATKTGVHEYVHFFDARSMTTAQRWSWKDAWGIALDPATDALAIASRDQPGAYVARDAWFPASRPD